jgi:hypothetical protein
MQVPFLHFFVEQDLGVLLRLRHNSSGSLGGFRGHLYIQILRHNNDTHLLFFLKISIIKRQHYSTHSLLHLYFVCVSP